MQPAQGKLDIAWEMQECEANPEDQESVKQH